MTGFGRRVGQLALDLAVRVGQRADVVGVGALGGLGVGLRSAENVCGCVDMVSLTRFAGTCCG